MYVKWPEDGIWYEASVAAHAAGTPGGGKARLDYAATDETETVALGELVDAKQIAFREARPAGHARVKGELAVARGNTIAAARAASLNKACLKFCPVIGLAPRPESGLL